MAYFSYKARDTAGKLIENHVEADDLKQAVGKLQQSGLFILDIKSSAKLKNNRKSGNIDLNIFSKNTK